VKRPGQKEAESDVPAALHGKCEATVIYKSLPMTLQRGTIHSGVVEPGLDYGNQRWPVTIGTAGRHPD